MPNNASENVSRGMLSGAVVATLIISMIAIAVWLAQSTGSAFEPTFAAVVAAIGVAVIAGYFTARSSSIIGFTTRWKADLRILFPPPDDEDDLLRDVRRTRDAFLTVAILGIFAIFVYSLQWKPVGFAGVFGSALMIALAAVAVGTLLGFLFAIPRTLSEDVRGLSAPAPPPTISDVGGTPTPAEPAAPVRSALFGVNTNLEQISDWLTKIIVGLGLIHLGKVPATTRAFLKVVAPSVGGQVGFALAVMAGYTVCGFMLGYLMTRLYLARAFVRASVASADEAAARARIRREIERVGVETATKREITPRSPEEDPITANEKVAAVRVEKLAEKADIEHLRAQVESLAHEYEAVRSSMPPGRDRTRAMEVVATKMRTLGRACYELLPSLAASGSPGRRLAAISFLEVLPNRDYLEWLAERFKIDMPFLLFHSAWALRHAARGLPNDDLDAVERAIQNAVTTMNAHPAPDPNALLTLQGALADLGARRRPN